MRFNQIANVVAVTMALILPGCAVISPTDAYTPVPTTKASRVRVPAPSHPFPEKETAPEGKLTLERSIEIALANNPEVAATLWDVSVAGSREDQAKAARWPSVTYEGSYTKYLNSRPLFEVRFNGERRIFSKQQSRGEVNLKLPLFTGGRIINDIKAAELFRLAEENRLSRTRDELIFNVSSTFYGMLSQEKVIDSLKLSLGAMEEQRKKVAAMLEVAKVARVDLLRTEVRLADLQQNLERETNVLEIQKRLLANLLGLDYEKAQVKIDGKLTFEKKGFKVATKYREGDYFYNIRVMIPEKHFASRQDIENLVLNSSQGGYLRLRDVATVTQAVGPVEIAREDQVKEVIVRGDAAGVSVGQALAELQAGLGKLALPVGYVLSYGGQAQMMAEMQRTLTMVLAFAIFFSFVVLAVQFP